MRASEKYDMEADTAIAGTIHGSFRRIYMDWNKLKCIPFRGTHKNS